MGDARGLEAAEWLPEVFYVGNGVLLLVLGWLLSELSHRFRTGHERRVAIGQALSVLLDIRHLLLGLAAVPKEFTKRLSAPPAAEVIIRAFLPGFLPNFAQLGKRYEAAVTALEGVSPVLAYQLRGKESVLPLLNQLSTIAVSEASAAPVWPGLETELLRLAEPRLEDLIRKVAWRHGLLSWCDVRQLLKKPFTLPVEVCDRIIGQLPKEALRDSGAQ